MSCSHLLALLSLAFALSTSGTAGPLASYEGFGEYAAGA